MKVEPSTHIPQKLAVRLELVLLISIYINKTLT